MKSISKDLKRAFRWQLNMFHVQVETLREVRRMAKTAEEFKTVIGKLIEAVTDFKGSVDADVAQTGVLVTEVRELVAAVKASASAVDFQEQVDAVEAAIAGVAEAKAKLASDNADVDAAIAESNAQVPPPSNP